MNIVQYIMVMILCHLACTISLTLALYESEKLHNDRANADPFLIAVYWTTHDYDLHTVASLQVVTNPFATREFSPVHQQVFANLKQLNAEYTRYAVWFPYPKLAVAELDPPSGIFQCGNVGENFSINLSCEQNGGVISQVDFAS
ncbi:unnamed protein product, partial [Rotaria socialis]